MTTMTRIEDWLRVPYYWRLPNHINAGLCSWLYQARGELSVGLALPMAVVRPSCYPLRFCSSTILL